MRSFGKKTNNSNTSNKDRVFQLGDYDATYDYVKKALTPLGLRLMRKDSPCVRLCWNIFYWIGFTNLVCTIIVDLILLQELIAKRDLDDDKTKIIRMLPCIGYLILANLKTYKMVYQRPVFENLVEELRGMWPQEHVSKEEHDILTKTLKELHFSVKAYYYCNYALAASITLPFYVELVLRTFGQDIPRVLPFDYWTPYDRTQPGWFEFTLAMQSWETMITVWGTLSGDLLFCVLMSHITAQFELLCVRIQRQFYVPVDQQLIADYPLASMSQKIEDGKECDQPARRTENQKQKEISEIVVRHNALIRLANDMENLYSFSLFFNFCSSSIIICFCVFCTVLIEKWNAFLYKSFLVTALSQTWILCWYGQKLLESSGKVRDALYNCGWYCAPKHISKSILIMMIRSRKSSYITTYGFSIICLINYTAIIKTAWSYFTLLLNFYDQ